MSTIIITGADASYFSLVQGTVRSLRSKPEGAKATLGFLDLGCTPTQLAWLQEQVDIIRRPTWQLTFALREQVPAYLKGIWGKPFLPRFFPGYETYLWIDADAWVQDWRGIELFLAGAALRGLAIMPEVDRGSEIQYGGLFGYWNLAFRWYKAAYGEQVAQKLWTHPMLNTGVFALRANTPHWGLWADSLAEALQQLTDVAQASVMTEQLALNRAVYSSLFDQTEMLPGWCNWTCHWGFPRWDPNRMCLVEPYLPHTPLGVVHLTTEKYDQVELLTIEGQPVTQSLRFRES
ncbi:hypothetical protein [Candidatus Cyanaurora vandensis]|uniref:hypothetical protein n=1 Tax=Candidatus Cyanaurora vandensis TaxID=2714958 RepID=UPI00257A91CC|nr:hypothetical protein [Candidatus Cyanaurora vandensis]